MPELLATLAAAGVLGLLGAGHCFAMCGGIVAALSFAASEHTPRWQLNLAYSVGRIASYGAIGALAATVAALLPETRWPVARTCAGLLLVAMGLYMAGWWRGLLWLERGGQILWRRIKPLADRLLPLDTPAKALGVGMVWGWLPCGLVYAALGYAAAQVNPWRGAAVMLAFGLGTLPALLIGGALASRLRTGLAKPYLRTGLALAFLFFGIWTIAGAWYHLSHHGAAGHHDSHQHHHNY